MDMLAGGAQNGDSCLATMHGSNTIVVYAIE